MIDLYCADTGNSVRALIALEECGLEYRRLLVDMDKREHKSEPYLRLNPFGRVPVMIDHRGRSGEPVTLTQSAAIMLYVAERTGKLPADAVARAAVLEWCLMAASDASPTSALLMYLTKGVPDFTDASRTFLERRFLELMGAVDRHLAVAGRRYLLGEYSLADMALFPVVRMRREMMEGRSGYQHLLRWADRIAVRPAVVRATTF